MKVDKAVVQETLYIAGCVLAVSVLLQLVFILIGYWDYTVLLGNLLGGVTAVGSFLLLGLTVQRAVTQDTKQAARTIQLSQSGRLLLQGLVLLVALLDCFNIWAAAVPLLIPGLGVKLRPLFSQKEISSAPAAADSDSKANEDHLGGDTV